MHRKMKKYVWWVNMDQDVKEFVKCCLPCSRNRSPVRSTTTMVLSRPCAFELVSLDYVGPLRVYEVSWYFLVVIDHCTRFLLTFPTKSPTGEFAADCLKRSWIPTFCAPKAVLVDNQPFRGMNFKTYVRDKLMSHLVYISPGYPQGNAVNESCHRVLGHSLKCELQMGGAGTPFEDVLAEVTLAYNSSYQSSIGGSPYSLMFGKAPLLPGFHCLSGVTSEDSRLAILADARIRRHLSTYLPPPDECTAVEELKSLRVGDFVLFLRNEADLMADTSFTGGSKYAAK
eukprot:GHVQ01042332.1.p1 GENE.GHVQ01042332.1~~GHVQ01042332.1.p1  ORF type:complete len:285 (-),score=26.53 GHVQ01042332.1:262-1116(-)